jgi:hypothetical protein
MKYLSIVLLLFVCSCNSSDAPPEVLYLPNCEKLIVPTHMTDIRDRYYLSAPFGTNEVPQIYTFYDCFSSNIKSCTILKIAEICNREAIQ